MKVLYLCRACFDDYFGDSVRIRELVPHLALKNEMTATAPLMKKIDYKTLGISSFRKLGRLRLTRFGQMISSTLSSALSLTALLNSEDYDLIFEAFGEPFSVTCGAFWG